MSYSGGCQCGAVRYRAARTPTEPHLCHCRMCQKAAGNFFIALIGVPRDALTWTRGAPATFQSSDKAARGFCRFTRHFDDTAKEERQPRFPGSTITHCLQVLVVLLSVLLEKVR